MQLQFGVYSNLDQLEIGVSLLGVSFLSQLAWRQLFFSACLASAFFLSLLWVWWLVRASSESAVVLSRCFQHLTRQHERTSRAFFPSQELVIESILVLNERVSIRPANPVSLLDWKCILDMEISKYLPSISYLNE